MRSLNPQILGSNPRGRTKTAGQSVAAEANPEPPPPVHVLVHDRVHTFRVRCSPPRWAAERWGHPLRRLTASPTGFAAMISIRMAMTVVLLRAIQVFGRRARSRHGRPSRGR